MSSPDWKHIFFKKIKNWSKFRLIPKNNFFEQKNSKKNDQKKGFFLKCKFEQKISKKIKFFQKSIKSMSDHIWVIWEKSFFSWTFFVLWRFWYTKFMIFHEILISTKKNNFVRVVLRTFTSTLVQKMCIMFQKTLYE